MNLKSLIPHLIAIGVFFATVFFLFAPQFQGKSLPKGDINAFLGAVRESNEFEAKTGEEALWTGTNFGGMPTFQISQPETGNFIKKSSKIFSGFMARPAGYFFAGMLMCYLLLVLLGVSPWLSIAGALGAGLATNGFVLFEAGHMTKVLTVFYLPLVAAGVLLAFQKKYLLGGLIFAFGMGLAIASNHPQMLYYFGLTLLFYGAARLVKDARAGELLHFGKAMGVLIIGLFLAFGTSASLLWTTKQYTAETMRGGQKLETVVKTDRNATVTTTPNDGLEWEYAMRWSNGLKDILATYSPLAAGGGNGQEVSNKTELGKALRRAGAAQPSVFRFPMYHGSLPFTEGPAYLGAVVWALFFFGLFTARRTLAIWLGGGTFLIFLMSMGKNVEGFNHFLYDTLPFLSIFRAPSSALSISTFMMVFLGIVGIHDWLKALETEEEKARKQLLYAGITSFALGLIITVIVPSFIDFTAAGDGSILPADNPNTASVLDALIDTRKSMYADNAWRSFLFVGLTFGALFLLFRRTISPMIGGLILAGLIAVDFTGINSTRMQAKDWRRVSSAATPFQPTAANNTILQDKDPNFRVYNATVSAFQDASTSYFHKSIGGYSAVKMRRINDVIDGYLARNENAYQYNYPARNDQAIFNMLNAKWFILPGQDGAPRAQQNPAAFGNVWLPSAIQTVPTNDAEFAALGSVPDLKGTAIVHQEFANEIAGLQPNGQGAVSLTEYTPNALSYSFNSPSEQLVVFSEMWYGPNLGWEATIDGQPATLIRANYLLRALRVPAGQHTIRMEFRPKSYFIGKPISVVSSLLVLLGLLGYIGYTVWQERKKGTQEA
ncbi:MAG: YfhO family protein [Lewinella sp.]